MSNPFCVSFETPPPEMAYIWCVRQFGRQSSWLENHGWRYNIGQYFFYDESNAMMFLLRWGGKVVSMNADYEYYD